MFRNSPLFRTTLVALALVVSTPVLAFDLPLLTFPEAPVATTGAATTSTANGK
jgi:hypothetical protein